MLFIFDDYTLDESKRELRRGEDSVKIDPIQVDLLLLFVRHPGQLLDRHRITEAIWDGRSTAESVLSVAVSKLRKVLGRSYDNSQYIESRYGKGYRFVPEVRALQGATLALETKGPRAKPIALHQLVGRSEQLEKLMAASSTALTGCGRVILIRGEPGIGKTRLAEALELCVEVRNDPFLAIWARCQQEANEPLSAIEQLLRGLATKGLEDTNESDIESRFSGEQPDVALERNTTRLLRALGSGDGSDHALINTLAHQLVHASRLRPLLLIVDDIQWADSASVRVLTYVADEVARIPVMLICCLRHGGSALLDDESGRDQRDISRLWNHRNCQHMELLRLKAGDVDKYVQARFGSSGNDTAELARIVFARSEGNPFFMVDLLRAQDATISRSADTLQPSSMALDAMRERLAKLPTRVREVLCAAAVLGHDFDIGLLSHLLQAPPSEVLDALSPHNIHGAVVTSTRFPGVVGAFSFDHELTRELLYNELAVPERGRLHLRAAQGLLARYANTGEVSNAKLAHHFLAAQPDGDIEVAVAYAQSAAADAFRLAAHAESSKLLQRALHLLDFQMAPRPDLRASLLLDLAMVERVQGFGVYNAHLAKAVAIAREHRLGRPLTIAGQLLSLSPDLVAHREASEVLEAANAALNADDHENLAIVRAHLSWTPPNNRSARRVAELIAQTQALAAKAGTAPARAALNDARLFFSAGPATFDQAENVAREIELECTRYPEVATHARRSLVARHRLIRAMQIGDRPAMARAVADRTRLLSEIRNSELSWHHERMLLVATMNEGGFVQVKSKLAALYEQATRLNLHASQLLRSLDHGMLLIRTSDVGPLAPRVRASIQVSEHDTQPIRAGKIRSMVEFGLLEEASSAIAAVDIESLRDLPNDSDYLTVLCHLAAGAAATRSVSHCEALLSLLSPYLNFYAASVSFHCHGSVATHVGMLYEALQEHGFAREHLILGRDRERAFGLMPCAAITSFRMARLLLRQPDDRKAMQLLREVRTEAARMGMQKLERDASALAKDGLPLSECEIISSDALQQ